MRNSELWRLVDEEFGRAYGRHLAATHVLHALGDRTVEQALATGAQPRRVWQALCDDMDVPPERWLGRDLPLRDHPERA
ncbi:DUF3046 domain-containing protein [Demetria terragena]|uniref:DUF3046 domain-containing protein n=1 Tax=Demetria terragena TaxID=63959 RepID=UPI0003740FF5|nr:DUF3046 domain-containing protein [Demetria terragena]